MEKTKGKHIAIILFGGTGARFGAPIPKQLVGLGGEPMLIVTLNRFVSSPSVEEIVVVAESSTIPVTQGLISVHGFGKIKAVIPGGKTRQESARLGLEYLHQAGTADHDLVMIADGDRPNVSDTIIRLSYEKAEEVGAAVVAIKVTDSVFVENGKVASSYLDREHVYLAQTPQTFRFKTIYRAHRKLARKIFTDDASLVVKLHKQVAIVPGSPLNLKITTPKDIDAYLAIKEAK